MGQQPSIQRLNPEDVFSSPEEVRARLTDSLYRIEKPSILPSLRNLFQERRSQESGYIGSGAFIDMIVEGDVSLAEAFRDDAGPLVYRMALRHGA